MLRNNVKHVVLGAGLVLATTSVFAAERPSIDGKWFAYPGQVDPLERTIDPPPPIPDPPLKPEYLQDWRDLRETLAEADRRGEPIASGYTHCIPDGMPTMMHSATQSER